MRKQKWHWHLLTIGLLVSSSSFILTHYFTISDGLNGFIKGTGIGLIVVALFSSRKLSTRS